MARSISRSLMQCRKYNADMYWRRRTYHVGRAKTHPYAIIHRNSKGDEFPRCWQRRKVRYCAMWWR